MSIWSRLKAFDHYRRAALSSLPIVLALLMYLIMGEDFLLSEWFLDLIFIPAFAGNLLSGSTYIARAIDLAPQRGGLKEKIGTWLGIFIGIAIGITLTLLHDSIPFFSSLSGIANVVLTLGQISVFAGFGNRIGSTLDKSRLPNEQKAIGAASVIGIVLGLALFLTSSVGLVSIMGITSFATMGAAVPFWLSGILFVSTFSSSLASFADYSAKAVNFIKSKISQDETTNRRVNERFHEYRGSFSGVSAGLIIGSLIVVGLLVTQPQVFIGAFGLIAAALIITTSMSVLGGLCSRVGRLIDGFKHKNERHEENVERPYPKPTPGSSPARMRKMLADNRPSLSSLKKPLLTSSSPIQIVKQAARVSEAGLYRPSSVTIETDCHVKLKPQFIFGSV